MNGGVDAGGAVEWICRYHPRLDGGVAGRLPDGELQTLRRQQVAVHIPEAVFRRGTGQIDDDVDDRAVAKVDPVRVPGNMGDNIAGNNYPVSPEVVSGNRIRGPLGADLKTSVFRNSGTPGIDGLVDPVEQIVSICLDSLELGSDSSKIVREDLLRSPEKHGYESAMGRLGQ